MTFSAGVFAVLTVKGSVHTFWLRNAWIFLLALHCYVSHVSSTVFSCWSPVPSERSHRESDIFTLVRTKMVFLVCSILIFEESEQSL